MQPEHIVYLESDMIDWERVEEINEWCMQNIGTPYAHDDNNRHVFDYTDKNGKWCAYINFHYNNGPNGRPIHSWCFRDQSDSLLFSLRWS